MSELTTRGPEVEANRLLGEAFRIANGTVDTRPTRTHLNELLAFARSWVDAVRGEGIKQDALVERGQHFESIAELMQQRSRRERT